MQGGHNLFAYAENNPIKYNDPSGMSPDETTYGIWDEEAQECREVSSIEFEMETDEPPPAELGEPPTSVRYRPARRRPPHDRAPVRRRSSPAPPPPVSPPDTTLYVSEGFFYRQWMTAARESENPGNPMWVRGTFMVLGAISGLVALPEEYLVRPLANTPYTVHNAGIGIGEHTGRAYLLSQQGEYAEATVEGLEAFVDFSEGFVSAASVAAPMTARGGTAPTGSPTAPAHARGQFNARNISQGGGVNCAECVYNFEASARAGRRVRTQLSGGGARTYLPEHLRRLRSVGSNPTVLRRTFRSREAVVRALQGRPVGTRFSIWANRGGGRVGHVWAGHIDSSGAVRFFEAQTQRGAPRWTGYRSFNVIIH
jgi:hypothetical protein